MKRVLLLCLACMVLVSAVASAEVKKGKDSFTGGIDIYSSVRPRTMLKSMIFSKNITGEISTFELVIIETQMKKYILADSPIEIKIGDFPVVYLDDYKYTVMKVDNYNVNYSSKITAKIDANVADMILHSKQIALRFEDNNALKRIYVLPDEVLAEWKEVINTEA